MFQSSPILTSFPDCSSQSACRLFLREIDGLLSESYRPQIVFDMSRVSMLNAMGIDLLLQCITKVAKNDGELKLAGTSAETSLVLELTQLNDVVEVFHTVQEAIDSFDGHWLADSVRRDSPASAA